MTYWYWKNTIVNRVPSKKLAMLFSLLLLLFVLASCGGSGGGEGRETSGTVNFPPTVFVADKGKGGTLELYASFDDGADIVKLSGTMVTGGNVVDFEVSPNGIFVAYVADQDRNDLFELYVVPVDKASDEKAVKINVPLEEGGIHETAAGSGEYSFAWAPNSSRVAYIADAADFVAHWFELFSATPTGKEKDLLSDLVDKDSDVLQFKWEPKGTLIAYVANQDTVGKYELYISPSDSNHPNRKASGIMIGHGIKEDPPGSGAFAYSWAPDSSSIAYIADQDVLDKFELFVSTANGTSNLKVSGPFADTRDVEEFKWAPDSQLIAYRANQNLADAIDLFTASPNINITTLQNSTGISPGQQVSEFKWAPDSSRIAFTSDRQATDFFRLFTVQPVNNNNIIVSGNLLASSDVTEFEWSSDSSQIAYLVEAQNFELYTTFPTSRPSTQIIGGMVIGGDVFEFEWAPDSSRIAYTADHNVGKVIELFSSTPDNSVTDQISGSLTSGGDVGYFKWASDSSGVGYIADQDVDNVDELYASMPNGNANSRLSGDIVSGGDVVRFQWVP